MLPVCPWRLACCTRAVDYLLPATRANAEQSYFSVILLLESSAVMPYLGINTSCGMMLICNALARTGGSTRTRKCEHRPPTSRHLALGLILGQSAKGSRAMNQLEPLVPLIYMVSSTHDGTCISADLWTCPNGCTTMTREITGCRNPRLYVGDDVSRALSPSGPHIE